MAEIVNLRLARKARQRITAARLAEANRARYGRTHTERQRDEAERAALARVLDGARRDRPDDPATPDGE